MNAVVAGVKLVPVILDFSVLIVILSTGIGYIPVRCRHSLNRRQSA
jgi:hypothetical protein